MNEPHRQPTVAPLWLSYPQAERLVGLSRTSLWRLARDGSIRTARVGRTVRIERRSLETFFEDHAQRGQG